MTVPVQQRLLPFHNNRQLFSDYYLNEKLGERREWQEMAGRVAPVLQEVRSIVAGYVPSNKEAQVEDDLVKPVLRALGHDFEVQPSLRIPGTSNTPDYVFYRDPAALNANKGKMLTDELPQQGALAVGDAKRWDRPLDVSLKGESGDNKNPSYQIANYILHSGLDWGILTNGRLWRLYHKETAHKLDRFYEVDLFELLDRGGEEAFLYFYAFFSREAFGPHELGLDSLLKASTEYARGVSEGLKGQVYDALKHLGQGFLDYRQNGLQADPATLKEIYDASLIVLYRLLFVLYAEARDLLPLRESDRYRNSYSLDAIKKEVADDLSKGKTLLPTSAKLWPGLKELFDIINMGSPPLKVATFNGGLFDPNKHPFLERYTVGDGHLQLAIDKLARVAGQFVDYRDLAVRHLGTIYEGLLEYHLEARDQGSGSRDRGSGVGGRILDGVWTIDLLNDKGERKATGSYYTPDYIVKYIVEQTLGPVVREATAGAKTDEEKAAAVLALNVLDPAMGSGHFPVEATEYLARALVELDARPPGSTGTGEADLDYWKRRVAQSCIYGVDLNPLAVELAKLSLWLATVAKDRPLSFLDHHLRTGNSLVGARIADLRLENQPAGKRKKTRTEAQKLEAAGYASMLEDDAFRQAMSTAVGSMWLIEETPGLTVAEVKEQEEIYNSLRETLTRRYGRLADLETANHFGVQISVDGEQRKALVEYATGGVLAPAMPQFKGWVEEAERIAGERHFFHWELEFPEVFFDRHGASKGEEAGFDAVVGNPPYQRIQTIQNADSVQASYFGARFASAVGKFDIYVLFVEHGASLLRTSGMLGFIVPHKFTQAHFGRGIREYLYKRGSLHRLLSFGTNQVFSDATTYTCLLFLKQEDTEFWQFYEVPYVQSDAQRMAALLFSLTDVSMTVAAKSSYTSESWIHGENRETFLIGKIVSVGQELGKLVDGVFQGVVTGLNGVFILEGPATARSEHDITLFSTQLQQYVTIERDILRAFVKGEDVSRYQFINPTRYILYPYKVEPTGVRLYSERELRLSFPKAYQYLERNREALTTRGSKNMKYPSWYALWNSRNPNRFARPKILVPDISYYGQMTTSQDEQLLHADTTYAISLKKEIRLDLPALLAIMNSRLMWFFMTRIGTSLRGGYFRYKSNYLERIPIRRINFTTPPDQREPMVEKGRNLYEHFLSDGSSKAVMEFVEHHLTREPNGNEDPLQPHLSATEERSQGAEASDVVHDLLAFLAERMLEMNKERQEAVEALMLDLEGVLSSAELAKIGRLWTPVAEPAVEATEQLGELVKRRLELKEDVGRVSEEQWKWLLKWRLKKVANMAELVGVYRRRQPVIRELDRKIGATDRLIDEVVYRLYGLTEEEIGVVERSTKFRYGEV